MYQGFAQVYDEFMQVIPYTQWADYTEKLWQYFGLKPQLVLDLACGTGSLTLELARRGYDMIGADASPEMLTVAREKAVEAGRGDQILYLLQDMREFELYGTVQSILCTCDSLNYLLKEEDLFKVFELCENYLDVGGLLMFDMKTEHMYRDILGDKVFADTTDDAAFVWQNTYYPEEKINEYAVTFFRKEAGKEEASSRRKLFGKKRRGHDDPEADQTSQRYVRFEEEHLQKAYDPERVIELLEKAHLKVEGVLDAFSLEPWREDSERITFVAREARKVEGDPAYRKDAAAEM